MDALPSISFVVIGRNEGPRLVRCLESILASDYPSDRIELIYVDSNSTDDSCDAAAKLGAKVIRVNPQRPCAAIGRNAGWRQASHNLVHFLDGDTILNGAWLRNAVQAMQDRSVACVFGRREEMAKRATIFNFWAHHDWYVPPGPADSCAGDALFRRDVLERAGGFDETLIAGEEPDLCFRIRTMQGLTILSLDEPMTLHDMGMTRWRQYWRRCTRTGHAYAEVGGRHRGMHRWRKSRWRNLFYAGGTPIAAVLSLGLWTPWPVIAWSALVLAALLRNAIRIRPRVESFSDALKYSTHHYLAKTPTAVGQCVYWVRSAFKRQPQALIEYRTPQNKTTGDAV
ncbi:MAG: glycosyltransferase [Planctomycetota bacterium]